MASLHEQSYHMTRCDFLLHDGRAFYKSRGDKSFQQLITTSLHITVLYFILWLSNFFQEIVAMRKHLLEDETNTVLPAKRRHTERTSPDEDATIPPRDFLSTLSDELILLVLSFLPTSSIIICQRYLRSSYISPI